MRKLNKTKLVYICILITMFSLGILSYYYIQNNRVTEEMQRLQNEIKLIQENNKQLEREIVNLHKEIEQYQEEEEEEEEAPVTGSDFSSNTSNDQTNLSDSTNMSEEGITHDSSIGKNQIYQDTSVDQPTQDEAINLVKEYIGFSNEPNVHFEVQGDTSDNENISIQVYEVVVDEGESQHTATWGWYGVNLNTGEVYEVNN